MLKELWRIAQPANPLTRVGLWTWLKRLYELPGLVSLWVNRQKLIWKGAKISPLAVCSGMELHGDGNNLTVGDYCSFGRVYLQAHGTVTIGDCVTINDGVRIISGSHDPNSEEYTFLHGPITINDYAWIATRAMILKGVTIGQGAIVGAGAVVTKDVPPFTIVAGNPARAVGQRENKNYRYKPSFWFGPISSWVGRQF